MEGLGYWLFLLILYGLSAMMKKRQQKEARQKLDLDDKEEVTSPPGFIQEIFGDLKEKIPEIFNENEKEPPSEKEQVLEQIIPEKVIPVKTAPISVSKSKPAIPLHIMTHNIAEAYRKKLHENKPITLFQDFRGLRKAIVMKEILDKPRAMRRAIR